jgi:hypothetical protein
MGNPVTASILKHIKDQSLITFVSAWDDLEEIIIQTYRNKNADKQDRTTFIDLHRFLVSNYSRHKNKLQLYWRQSHIKGETTLIDPFERVLAETNLVNFIGNGEVLRCLPAAREAINHYLLDLSQQST